MNTFTMNGAEYVEFLVGAAKQAAHFYQLAFGFRRTPALTRAAGQ